MLLLERDHFLKQLHDLAARAAGGDGGIALVSGEAGIGKSSLVGEFATQLKNGPLALLRGTCDDLFTPRPLGPLLDIAADQPDGPLARAHGDREAFFSAFLDTIRARPVAIVIEDVHWADEATLDVLCYAGRRIAATRALLVLTFRDDELTPAHPLRRTLADFPRAITNRLHLPRLSERAVTQLARHAGRSDVGLYAVTSGNPFYVTEALASDSAEVPPSVRDAVLARARTLDDAAREVLDVASVVPGRIESWLLTTLLGSTAAAIDACSNAGVLQVSTDSVCFRHQLARRAWEDSLPPAKRVSLHERVLSALLEQPTIDSARIVHHAERAGDVQSVVRHAPLAAVTAARLGAHLQAAELYGAIIPHIGALPATEQAQLLEAYAMELQTVAHIDDGLHALGQALHIWRQQGDRLREGDTLRQLGRLNWYRGNLTDSLRLGAEAIEVLEPLGPTAELAMAYSARSQAYMCMEEHGPAIEWGELAIARGRELGRSDVVMHSLNNVGTSRLYRGEELGLEMLEESLRMATASGRHLDAGRALVNISETLTCRREFARAEPWEEATIRFCRDHDIDAYMLCVLGDRSQVHLVLGDWDRSTDDAEAVLSHPRCPPVDRIPALAALGRIRARRGDPDVDVALDEALAIARPSGEVLRMWPVTAARLEAAWLRDTNYHEIELGRQVVAMAKRVENRWALGEVAFWLQMLGDDVEISELAADPYHAALHGEYLDAAEGFETIGMSYDRALMLALSGAESAMREAFEFLADVGARATAERLVGELRGRGVARIPRGPAAATRSNPARLTQKQAAVLELIAAGLSNHEIAERLFISTKTAAHHVSAILAKLDARTRAEAAARAHELGIVQPK